MDIQISLCKFHKNSLSERLLEGKGVTLWDEFTDHKEISQQASFSFWLVDISFFSTALYGLTNITFQIPQDSLGESLLEGKTVILWDELREDKAVSEKTSFQFLTEDISFFTLPSKGFQISPSKFHKNSRSERLLEGKTVTLWDELT